MRACVSNKCRSQMPGGRRKTVHGPCSGRHHRQGTEPTRTVRMPPPKAIFIANSMLRQASLGINVPKHMKPQHQSEELVMRYFLDVWNESDVEAAKELCSDDIVMADTTLWPDPFCGQDHVVRVIEEYMSAFKLFRYTYVQALGSPDGKEVLFSPKADHSYATSILRSHADECRAYHVVQGGWCVHCNPIMKVLAHWSIRCAQLGDLWNRPPTGTVEEISGMTRFMIVNNKIARIDTFREKMQHEMASADFGL